MNETNPESFFDSPEKSEDPEFDAGYEIPQDEAEALTQAAQSAAELIKSVLNVSNESLNEAETKREFIFALQTLHLIKDTHPDQDKVQNILKQLHKRYNLERGLGLFSPPKHGEKSSEQGKFLVELRKALRTELNKHAKTADRRIAERINRAISA